MSGGPLIVALPSKGRLHDAAFAWLEEAGLRVKRAGDARAYQGVISGIPDTEVLYLSASEIAAGLHAGALHLGITGLDLIKEIGPEEEAVHLVQAPGFGYADVVVAVPRSWIDVSTMADLEDVAQAFRARRHRPLRVATKYLALTRGFFARHGLAEYRIVESQGATEGAPAAGTAEMIVDITSSGATLAANNLKVLDDGVILKSEAFLAASLRARWSPAARTAFALIADLTGARERGRATRTLQASPPPEDRAVLKRLESEAECIISAAGGGALTVHCPEEHLYPTVEALRRAGCRTVVAGRPDYVFSSGNPLFEAFAARLRKR
ncbi:MAG: ATP phosphoribosyltransferase [Alphaproteobacteria bacterium]